MDGFTGEQRRNGRRRARSIGIAFAVVAAGLTVVAPAAHAAVQSLTFEGGYATDGAVITDQYYATYGVTFGTAASVLLPGGLKGDAVGAGGEDCGATQATIGRRGQFDPAGASEHSAASGTCHGGEFPSAGGFTFSMNAARTTVAVQVYSAPNLGTETDASALLQAYDGLGNLVDVISTTTLSPSTWTPETLTTQTSSPIQFVHVQGLSNSSDGINIDDIELDDPAPGSPSWSFGAATDPVQVGDGGAVDVPLDMSRLNGSTGGVQLDVSSADPNVTATVSPDPVAETSDTATLHIVAAAGASGTHTTVTVTSHATQPVSAGTYTGSPVAIDVTVVPSVQLEVDFTPTNGKYAAGCDVTGSVLLTARSVTGTAHLTIGAGPSSVTVSSLPDVTVDHDGTYSVPFTLSRPAASFASLGAGAQDEVAVTESGVGSPVTAVGLLTTSAATDPGDTAILTTPHQSVVIAGAATTYRLTSIDPNLPCAPLDLELGNQKAIVPATITTDGFGDSTISAPVPEDATSGAITLVDPAHGDELIDQLGTATVDDVRRLDSVGSQNVIDDTFTWEDMERTFGSDNVDDCVVVCWKDPVAVKWYHYIEGMLKKGLCFGFADLATQLVAHTVNASDFVPAATFGQELHVAYGTDSNGNLAINDPSPLGDAIVSAAASQVDLGFMRWFSDYRAEASTATFAGFGQHLSAALAQKGHVAMITMNVVQNGVAQGHAVMAYGADITPQKISMYVYDPNVPFSDPQEPRDEGTPDGIAHDAAVTHDVITVVPQAVRPTLQVRGRATVGPVWSFPFSGSATWNGPLTTIAVVPTSALPTDPQVVVSPPDLQVEVATFFGGALSDTGSPLDAPVSLGAVTVNGKAASNADGPIPGSGFSELQSITGAGAGPGLLSFRAGHTYTVGATGTRNGAYSFALMDGSASGGVAGATATKGRTDTVTLTPGHASIGFRSATGKPASLELVSGRNATQHLVLVDVTGTGKVTASMSGGAISVKRTGGDGTVRFELSKGGSSSTITDAIALADGATATTTPSWKKLGSQLSVGVTAGGRRQLHVVALRTGGHWSKLLVRTPKPGVRSPARTATTRDLSD